MSFADFTLGLAAGLDKALARSEKTSEIQKIAVYIRPRRNIRRVASGNLGRWRTGFDVHRHATGHPGRRGTAW